MKIPKQIVDKFYPKDIDGNIVKMGDILIECTGEGRMYGYFDNKWFKSYTLWQFWGQHDSMGYYYNVIGKISKFWHVDISSSRIINKKDIPPKLLYTFFHGDNHFDSTADFDDGINKIIKESDWDTRIITPKEVKRYKKMYNEKTSD